ncbi:hypothetical protein LUZ60_005278 [Juncus effusus]|nr:hypothetical protein LUZ60_005278 [Juncus effusus]
MAALDYDLPAMKLFVSELREAEQNPNYWSLFGVRFQRAWLQGVLVAVTEGGRLVLDDGSDVVELQLSDNFKTEEWKPGMYVMTVGPYIAAKSDKSPYIKVQKLVDLSSQPDREALWNLEVYEAHKLFYFK